MRAVGDASFGSLGSAAASCDAGLRLAIRAELRILGIV